MVGDSQRQFRLPHLAILGPQSFERLGTGDFVNKMTVDIEQTGTVGMSPHHVIVPYLLIKGAGAG